MKNRIISLILALATLLSCMSLSVFATGESPDGESAVTQSETVNSTHTDEQLTEILTNNTKFGTANKGFSFHSGDATTADGRIVIGKDTTVNKHVIDMTNHTDTSGTGGIANFATTHTRGNKFVVQMDFEITDEAFVGTYYPSLMQMASYFNNKGNGGNPYVSGVDVQTILGLMIYTNASDPTKNSATLWGMYQGISNRNDKNCKITTVKTNTPYTIALHFDMSVIDEATGTYGVYDVYLNDELVKADVPFASREQHESLIFDSARPYFTGTNLFTKESDGSYTLTSKRQTAYFFTNPGTLTDADTNGDEIPDIYQYTDADGKLVNYAGITKDTVPAKFVELGKADGIDDYMLGFLRFAQVDGITSKNYQGDAIYFDNMLVYYADEYQNLKNHSFAAGEHVHNFDKTTTDVTYGCVFCDATKLQTKTLDANKDRICDVCVEGLEVSNGTCTHDYKVTHSHSIANNKNEVTYTCSCGHTETFETKMHESLSGGIVDASLIDDIGGDVIYASEFDSSTNPKINGSDPDGMLQLGNDNGNYYIKYGAATAKGYLQVSTNMGSAQAVLYNFNEFHGRAYTISMRFKKFSTYSITGSVNLFDLYSYTTATVDAGGTVTKVGAHAFAPLRMDPSGNLLARNGETGSYASTGVKLASDTYYDIMFTHHPKGNTFDLFVDGKCIVKDMQAMTDTDKAKFTWSGPLNISGITDSRVNYTDPENKIMTVTHEDFVLGMVRFVGLSNITADQIAFDAMKVYYSDRNLECAHNFKGQTCEWCGLKDDTYAHCDICDGKAISANAAVVAKSVSLGELIDMNVYVKLAGEKSGTATLSAGDRSKTFDLSELEADAEGRYKLSLPLTSIMMAEDVTLAIDGGTYTTSIKEYAEELIKITANDNEKALAKALLNYGAAAQEYFAIKNSDDELDDVLANAGLADADKVVAALTAADLEAYKFSASGMTADVRYIGATLTFSSKMYMKVYFTASESATVTVNGKIYEKAFDGENYYVTVTAATPIEAMRAAEFVITDGNTVASGDISVFTAIHAALANHSANTALVSLVTAYARYCQLTGAYAA
ncbi:MAG: hypothetical protein IKB38_09540 [Clostridia bacterium]|nr:hypothetical protein [Clostridia bacterium]